MEIMINSGVFPYVISKFMESGVNVTFQVMERLGSIDKRYKELQELNKIRKQRLLDALSLYKLFNEADAVDAWINEKEKFLHTIVPSKDDMEELEVMRHRSVLIQRSCPF